MTEKPKLKKGFAVMDRRTMEKIHLQARHTRAKNRRLKNWLLTEYYNSPTLQTKYRQYLAEEMGENGHQAL